MDEFKEPYLALFNELSDIMEELDRQNYGLAKQKIIEAQREAEELFISGEKSDN